MLRIAITEDLASERERLKEYVQRYALQKNMELELCLYSDGQELVSAYGLDHQADLILLDIDMNQMDGITAARKIRETDENVQIVFITRMVQHALEGFEVGAADYIIKPVAYELFAGKMDRVMRHVLVSRQDDGERKISLKTQTGQQYLQPRDIICAESEGKRVKVHLDRARQGTDTLEVTMPLYQLEKELQAFDFFRCHSAFLVSLRAVTGYSQTDVFLGELRVPLSKHRRREFAQALAAYHMKRV